MITILWRIFHVSEGLSDQIFHHVSSDFLEINSDYNCLEGIWHSFWHYKKFQPNSRMKLICLSVRLRTLYVRMQIFPSVIANYFYVYSHRKKKWYFWLLSSLVALQFIQRHKDQVSNYIHILKNENIKDFFSVLEEVRS